MNNPIEAVIFDLDGTLIDSEPLSVRAMLESLEKWGTPLSPEKIPQIVGLKWEEAERRLRQWIKLPMDSQSALQIFRKRYHELTQEFLVEVKGASACVRDISNHVPVALVSGSHRSEIEFALKTLGIKSCFQFYLGAEDYPRSKPAPDGFEKAMNHLGVNPNNVWIFEDSEAGVHSGKDAGARVVAIDGTNHYGHDTSRADAHVTDLSQVDFHFLQTLQQFPKK